ncbi:MAG: DnaJ domain-containing protein, partial [Bdellovibrionota bacterium]
KCGEPQPLVKDESYFSVLNVSPKFSQDLDSLEKKFYAVSKILHPDRFTHRDADTQKRSLERMSFLNEAYRTLKNPTLLREYLLAHRGVPVSDPKAVPTDFAESWFVIQDLVMDSPDEADLKLNEFMDRLKTRMAELDQKILTSEKVFDESGSVDALNQIGAVVPVLNYLKSLTRNVIQLRLRLAAE